jgi:hypothetical protein
MNALQKLCEENYDVCKNLMKMATAREVSLEDLRKTIPESTTVSMSNTDLLKELPYHSVSQPSYEDLLKELPKDISQPSNADLLKELPYHSLRQSTYENLLKESPKVVPVEAKTPTYNDLIKELPEHSVTQPTYADLIKELPEPSAPTYEELFREIKKVVQQDERIETNNKAVEPPSPIKTIKKDIEFDSVETQTVKEDWDPTETVITRSNKDVESYFTDRNIHGDKNGDVVFHDKTIKGIKLVDVIFEALENRHLLPPLTEFVREKRAFTKLEPSHTRKLNEPIRDDSESLFKTVPINENQPLLKKMKLIEENNRNLSELINDNEKSQRYEENKYYLRGSGKTLVKSSSNEENDRNNSNVQRKLYDCKDCKKRFSQQSTLTRHVKNAHQAVKYSCFICKRSYIRKDYLTKHTKKAHKL